MEGSTEQLAELESLRATQRRLNSEDALDESRAAVERSRVRSARGSPPRVRGASQPLTPRDAQLVSDIKKCSAVTRRVKQLSDDKIQGVKEAVVALNLRRFLSEVRARRCSRRHACTSTQFRGRYQIAAGIVESVTSFSRPSDMAGVAALCGLLHQRYEGFLDHLNDALQLHEQRCDPAVMPCVLRLRAELLLCGAVPEPGPVMRLLRRMCAGGDGPGAAGTAAAAAAAGTATSTAAAPSAAIMTFSQAIVHFLRFCGYHFLGSLPASLRGPDGEGGEAAASSVRWEEVVPAKARATAAQALRAWWDQLVAHVRRCPAAGAGQPAGVKSAGH